MSAYRSGEHREYSSGEVARPCRWLLSWRSYEFARARLMCFIFLAECIVGLVVAPRLGAPGLATVPILHVENSGNRGCCSHNKDRAGDYPTRDVTHVVECQEQPAGKA